MGCKCIRNKSIEANSTMEIAFEGPCSRGLPTCQTGQALRLGLEALLKVKTPKLRLEISVGNFLSVALGIPSSIHQYRLGMSAGASS